MFTAAVCPRSFLVSFNHVCADIPPNDFEYVSRKSNTQYFFCCIISLEVFSSKEARLASVNFVMLEQCPRLDFSSFTNSCHMCSSHLEQRVFNVIDTHMYVMFCTLSQHVMRNDLFNRTPFSRVQNGLTQYPV